MELDLDKVALRIAPLIADSCPLAVSFDGWLERLSTAA